MYRLLQATEAHPNRLRSLLLFCVSVNRHNSFLGIEGDEKKERIVLGEIHSANEHLTARQTLLASVTVLFCISKGA